MSGKAEKTMFAVLKRRWGKKEESDNQVQFLENYWKSTSRACRHWVQKNKGDEYWPANIFFKNKSCKIKLISFLEKVTSPGDKGRAADILKFILSQASDLLYLTFS